MRVKQDDRHFDVCQEGLLRHLFTTVNDALGEAIEMGALQCNEEEREGVLETIVFGVAAAIDGSAVMAFENHEIHPYLAFKDTRTSDELIVHRAGSYLHEMVMGYLDDIGIEDL
ncbi:MAG: hypothetical protein H6510_17095 [Acidobacteria bacterium]|nr:hypothetical protein [Acidobacteriota bacterium]MCB9399531.1 hypothetical protein [Acidobacteriota bacterium]